MTNGFTGTDSTALDVGGDSQDELFGVLSHRRRRMVLRSLQDADAPVSVTELAKELTARKAQRPAADRTGDGADAIEVTLVHSHLPKMADAGVVEYDDDRQTVTLADQTEEVRDHLQTAGGD